ncbi:MAG: hypothetical protein Q7S65_00805 [Nanoarchaeota archaeon]|nr:hypothetical protein [Nanoarchaeota archaeon]
MEQVSSARLRRFLWHLANVTRHYLEGETAQHFLQHHVETLEQARKLSAQIHTMSTRIDDLVKAKHDVQKLTSKSKPRREKELARIKRELAELRVKRKEVSAHLEQPRPAPQKLTKSSVLADAQEQLAFLEKGYTLLSQSPDANTDRLASIKEKMDSMREKITGLSASRLSGH